MGVASCIESIVSPSFIPCIVSGILYGVGAIGLYDKAKRQKFFLPYFYLANAGLLYAVAQVFLLVWDRDMEGDEEHRNPFPLHSALILTTLGSSFVMLALYRLVQVWREIGLKGGDSSMLRVAAPLGVAVSTVLSLVGDVILLRLDEEEHEDTGGIVWSSRKALLVKGVGSLVGLVLLLIYIALIVVTAVQQRRGRRGTADHQSLVPVLLVLGILAIVHWSYFAVVVLSSALPLADTSMDSDCNSGNWQLATGLIAAPDIVLLATAFLYDLTRVKNGAKPLSQFGYTGLDPS